jgi:fructoselysine 6-kinase
MTRILCIGDNVVDLYLNYGQQFPGGNAANVAALSRRLGAEAGYLGCVGDDAFGELILSALAAEGVDTSHCRQIEGGVTPWCRIEHDGNDRRFCGSIQGVRHSYNLSGSDEAYISSYDLIHTSTPSKLNEKLPWFRQMVPLTSYDYGNHWARSHAIEKTAAYVDIGFLSCGDHSVHETDAVMRKLAEQGTEVVVATLGGRGSRALVKGKTYSQSALQTSVVDTLGAGDGFIAGFLVSFLTVRDINQALKSGAQSAAAVCSYMGAFGHGQQIDVSRQFIVPS